MWRFWEASVMMAIAPSEATSSVAPLSCDKLGSVKRCLDWITDCHFALVWGAVNIMTTWFHRWSIAFISRVPVGCFGSRKCLLFLCQKGSNLKTPLEGLKAAGALITSKCEVWNGKGQLAWISSGQRTNPCSVWEVRDTKFSLAIFNNLWFPFVSRVLLLPLISFTECVWSHQF